MFVRLESPSSIHFPSFYYLIPTLFHRIYYRLHIYIYIEFLPRISRETRVSIPRRFNRVKGRAQSTRLSYSISQRDGATNQFDLSVNPTLVKPTCLSRVHIYIYWKAEKGVQKAGQKRVGGRRWGKGRRERERKKERGGGRVSRSSEFSRGTIKLFLKYSHITGRWYANIPVPGLCRPFPYLPPSQQREPLSHRIPSSIGSSS